jgi:hypothetical protein
MNVVKRINNIYETEACCFFHEPAFFQFPTIETPNGIKEPTLLRRRLLIALLKMC